MLITLIFIAAAILCLIRTVFFAVYTIRGKNPCGGIMLFVISAAVCAGIVLEIIRL